MQAIRTCHWTLDGRIAFPTYPRVAGPPSFSLTCGTFRTAQSTSIAFRSSTVTPSRQPATPGTRAGRQTVPSALGTSHLAAGSAFTPATWFWLALLVLVVSKKSAETRSTDTFDDGDADRQAETSVASISEPLAKVLYVFAVPCYLALMSWRAILDTEILSVVASGAAWTLSCTLLGACVGASIGRCLVWLWGCPRRMEEYLQGASDRQAFRTQRQGQVGGGVGTLWQRATDGAALAAAHGAQAAASAVGGFLGWRAASAESTVASAVAAALGAPAVAKSVRVAAPQLPPWTVASLTVIGAAAAMWCSCLPVLSALPATAPDWLWDSQPAWYTLVSHANTQWATVCPWVTCIPSVQAAVKLSSITSGMLTDAASAAASSWSAGAQLGQALATWCCILPWLRHTSSARNTADSSTSSQGATPTADAPPTAPDAGTGGSGGTAGGGGGAKRAGDAAGGTASEPGSALRSLDGGGQVVEFIDGRVWVRVGENQEVALTPREVSQLLPYNTLLPGQIRLAGPAAAGAAAAAAASSPPDRVSTDDEPIVEAEVRDYESDSDSSGSDTPGAESTSGSGRRAGKRRPAGKQAGSAAKGAGASGGSDAVVSEDQSVGAEGTGTNRVAQAVQDIAQRVKRALAANPPLTALLIGITVALLRWLWALNLTDTAADSLTLTSDLSSDLQGEASEDMALRATPWDWRAAQGLATSALTALSWGADAAPLLLQLLMACVTAAACLMPAERLGARRQGVGLLFSAMKPSVSVGEEKTEGDTGVWAGLRGTLQRTGGNLILDSVRRLLLPGTLPDIATICAALIAMCVTGVCVITLHHLVCSIVFTATQADAVSILTALKLVRSALTENMTSMTLAGLWAAVVSAPVALSGCAGLILAASCVGGQGASEGQGLIRMRQTQGALGGHVARAILRLGLAWGIVAWFARAL